MALKRISVLVTIATLLTGANAWAAHRRVHGRPARHRHHHLRRLVWRPLFPGSHEMLVKQNEVIDHLELPRIADDEELEMLEDEEILVPVEDTRALSVAANLAENRRYCRPWTRDFLQDLSEAYYQEFRRPLVVTSLVRTMEQQHKLRRHNRNAAPEEGDTASTHLTGMTIDILKRGMTRKQHQWVEQYFLPLKAAGKIDPIEERRQPVFHVVVFNTYSDVKDFDDRKSTDEMPVPAAPSTALASPATATSSN